MICGRPIFHRACILLRFPLPIGAAKRGFREGCTLVVDRLCDFQSDLGLHHHGVPTASERGAESDVAYKWAGEQRRKNFRVPKRGRNCCITPAFSEISKKGGGIDITKDRPAPAFSGVQKRAEMLRHLCIMGGPELREQNQKWPNWGQGQNFGCAVQKNTTKNFSHKWCVCVEKHP